MPGLHQGWTVSHAFLALSGGSSSGDTAGTGLSSEKRFPWVGCQLWESNWPSSRGLYVEYGMRNGT